MKSGEEGSTLVEMAFSCTILLSVMIGIFQVSLMLYCYHFISYAAREGARYAIVRGSNSCLTAGISTSTISNCNQTGSGTAIVNYVGSLNFPGIDWSKCQTVCHRDLARRQQQSWKSCAGAGQVSIYADGPMGEAYFSKYVQHVSDADYKLMLCIR